MFKIGNPGKSQTSSNPPCALGAGSRTGRVSWEAAVGRARAVRSRSGCTMSACGSISAAKPDRPVSPCLPEDGRELRIPARGARKPLGMVQPALRSLDSPGPRAVISRGEAGGTRGAVPLRNATPSRKRPGFFLFREWAIWGFEGLGQRHPGNRAILKGIGRCGEPPRRLLRLAASC